MAAQVFGFTLQDSTMQSNEQVTFGVGIDTARYGHDVSFLREDRQPATASIIVTEDAQGYREEAARNPNLSENTPVTKNENNGVITPDTT